MLWRLAAAASGFAPPGEGGLELAALTVQRLRMGWRALLFPVLLGVASAAFGAFALVGAMAEPQSADNTQLMALIYLYLRILFADWVIFAVSLVSSFFWFRGWARRPELLRDFYSAAVPCGEVGWMAHALPVRPWMLALAVLFASDAAVLGTAIAAEPSVAGFAFVPFLLFAFSLGSPVLSLAIVSRLLVPSANVVRVLLRGALLAAAFPAGLTAFGVWFLISSIQWTEELGVGLQFESFAAVLLLALAIPTAAKFVAARLLFRGSRRRLERLYSEGFDEVMDGFRGR